jgi:ATP synthase mitochondrial F1 complex assembly factor 1
MRRLSSPRRLITSATVSGGGFTYPAPRRLAELMKLSLLEHETPEKIQEIWTTYHDNQPLCVSSVWNNQEWAVISKRAVGAKFFTFPIRRDKGYFVVLTQYQDSCWLVTYLEDFKRNPAGAQPYMTVTIYDDLVAGGKNSILVRGDLCSPMIGKDDGVKLMELLRRFYAGDEGYKFVEQFNFQPREFNHEDVFPLV